MLRGIWAGVFTRAAWRKVLTVSNPGEYRPPAEGKPKQDVNGLEGR